MFFIVNNLHHMATWWHCNAKSLFSKNTKLFCTSSSFVLLGPNIWNTFRTPPSPLYPQLKKSNLYKYRQPCAPVTDTSWRPLTQETSRLHMPPQHICKNKTKSPPPLKIHTVDILPSLYYTCIIYNIVSAEMMPHSHRPAQSCWVRGTWRVSLPLFLYLYPQCCPT